VDRRTLLKALPIAIYVPPSARAQTTARVYRVAVLAPSPAPQLSNAFIAAMGDRGYRSRNLVVDVRYTQGNPDLAESLARELVAERIDVIVTAVTATAMAARRATKVVPIVDPRVLALVSADQGAKQ